MRLPLITLALGACTSPTPTEVPTCGVQATSNLSGTVPFTSDVTVDLSGEDVERTRRPEAPVDHMGGTIRLESTAGEGTVAVVWLPVSEAPDAAVARTAPGTR